MTNKLLVTLMTLLAVTAIAAVTPSAKAADSPCSNVGNEQQCVRFFTNTAGKPDYIGLTIHYDRQGSDSLSLQAGRSGHLDGSSDRQGRWWRDMGPRRWRDRRQYRYWRACALSVSHNWICTPWVWAGPGV
jgi:hypothetical protein